MIQDEEPIERKTDRVWIHGQEFRRADVELLRRAAESRLIWDRVEGTYPQTEQEKEAERATAAKYTSLANRIEALFTPPPSDLFVKPPEEG